MYRWKGQVMNVCKCVEVMNVYSCASVSSDLKALYKSVIVIIIIIIIIHERVQLDRCTGNERAQLDT